MTCAVCGATNTDDARFCFRCGSTLTASAPTTGMTVDFAQTAEGARTYTRDDVPEPQPTSRVYNTPPPTAARVYELDPAAPPRYASDQWSQTSGSSMPSVPSYNAPAMPMLPTTNSKAVAALIMSILSFFVLPLIGSIIGIVLGYQARGEIRASQGQQGGEGLATAGIVVGWVHIGLFVLVAVGFCAIFGLAAVLGTS